MTGIVSITFRHLDYKEIVDLCVKTGIEAIEWGGDVHCPHGDLQRAQEVYDYSTKNGIICYAYGSYYKAGSENAFPFKDALESAKILKTKYIRVWAGKKSPKDADEAYRIQIADEIRQMCIEAKEYDIIVALEYHRKALTEDLETTLELMDRVGCDNLKTFWQPNPDVSYEEHFREIDTLKDRIVNIHTFYWDSHNRYEFKKGLFAWREYIKHFEGYDIPYMLEHVKDEKVEQFIEDAEALHSLFAEKKDK